jgi:hypothetical protein
MKNSILLFLLIFSTALGAQENRLTRNESSSSIDFDFESLNIFIIRNDTDFDRTPPYYDKYGQEMGLVGTFFKPMLSIRANNHLRFYWESEIGLDLWSQNNPDIGLDDKNSKMAIGIKQRELYNEVNYDQLHLKVGFQRVMDLSTLFINHWIGALKIGYINEEYGVNLLAGEFPDQTYKGWDFSSQNFLTDVYVIGLDGFYNVLRDMKLYLGIYFVDDMHLIDRRRQVTAYEGKISYDMDILKVYASGIYLKGYRHKGGTDLKNTDISAFGLITGANFNYEGILSVEGVFSYMSADDNYEGNDSGAFLFSSRRTGPSLLLSENDMRPIGDNIDKRIGAFDGVFYEMKAGLIGLDVGVYYTHDFLKVGPISGLLFTANDANSMNSNFVGWENDLLVDLSLFDRLLKVQLIGGILIPGEAGAALLNTINRTKYKDDTNKTVSVTEPIYYFQSGIMMFY